jgi:hypothetical protein
MADRKALMPFIVVRNLVGFAYGAAIWSGLTGKDFAESPLVSSFGCSLWGALGLMAADACANFGPRPMSDLVVIGALTYSGYQKYIK